MSRAIDIAKGHYDRLEPTHITVPEWGDMEIYTKPMTLGEQEKMRRITAQKGENSFYGFAALIVAKASDKNGVRLFDDKDLESMMAGTDAEVVKRTAQRMITVSEVGDLKKS